MKNEFIYTTRISGTYPAEKHELAISLVITDGAKAWQDYVHTLTESENLQLQKQLTPAARNSFVLGKMAAKLAVSELNRLPLNTITIGHGVFGFPVIEARSSDHVSIAHTANSGAALCFSQKILAGIDIEELNDANNAVILTLIGEREILKKPDGTISDSFFYHLVWTAKEALSKTIKTGFLVPFELFEIKTIIRLQDYYKIEFVNFSLFTGIVFQTGQHLIALVIPERFVIQTDFIREIVLQFQKHKENEFKF